ncbi:MAG: DNA-directed RNA polymerase subunit beta [Candidatus Blackburnbacteria bacterium]|nr:DNA-directed RNA polymerase subunit beta [Candidatus Blackburnbacteria bacterium]
MSPSAKPKYRYLTQAENTLPQLDLLAIQKESWVEFLRKGIGESLKVVSPISDFTGKNWELSFGEYRIGEPSITPSRAREKGLTYSSPLYVNATLLNKKTGKTTTQEVFLGDIPQMTVQGTYVVNGVERAIVNQIVRSPGVYFFGEQDPGSGRMLYRGEIRPSNGSWLEFEVSKQDVIIARIDRRRKLPATMLLRALGLENEQLILEKFADIDTDEHHKYLESTLAKDSTHSREEALLEIYRRMRPGEPAVLDNAQNLFHSLFFDPRRYNLERVGRYKLNKRLGMPTGNEDREETKVLSLNDFVAVLRYLVGLQNNQGKVDDIDHLANRRIRRAGELVNASAFKPGLLRLERAIKEKMSLTPTDDLVNPSFLVNARPVIAALNEFFRSNQLSVILDQTNPLAEIDNLRRISVMGPGGITRDRASFSIRDINASQYGRIDPVRSPEGPNIGLVTYLALYTRVNDFGFLESPYRKVEKTTTGGKTKVKVSDEAVYLPADDEENYHITHASVKLDEKGYITDEWVPMRFNGEFTEGPVELIDYIDYTPRQVVGTSASLIPFLQHDEANRALMGTHMQCQAVPLVRPAAPLMMTGMEASVAQALNRVVRAANAGTVTYIDSERVEIALEGTPKNSVDGDLIKRQGGKEVYTFEKFTRTSQSTCFNQRPLVTIGDKVKAGDIIADGPAADQGALSLGQNLLVAYCSFEGLGFEDAIAISERVVREDLLTSIHIEEYTASVVDTKLGPEELTRDIPNVAEGDLANLAEDGIVVIGAEVGPNDILVGKIAPKGETELTAEERLLRAIFGEKAREVRDTSLRVPHGEHGIVVDVQILDREKGDELDPGTLKEVIVRVAQMRKLSVGDKIAGRHGNKGVISKIVPIADMPHLEDGTPIDIVISPLSVLARMNLGQLLEAQLGWAADKLGQRYVLPVFDKLDASSIEKIMNEAGLPVSGKTQLYDGRTGEPLKEQTFVGKAYFMKLIHMVEDKTHARSTGPYSLVTQQPLGGKAQMGGQRLGEMEVWALEAHRAAYTLQEMLTIKSDDVVGRARAFEAIVKGTEIPEATIPESFKVLVRELNSLGFVIQPEGAVVHKMEEEAPTVVGGLTPVEVPAPEPVVLEGGAS